MARPEDLDPVLADLASRISDALDEAGLPDAPADLERPRQPEHGDWATTVALRLAKPAGKPPREIAQTIADTIELPEVVSSVDVAGPGFVNFRLAPTYFADLVRRIVTDGDAFGRRRLENGQRELVNVEFVSANPTGPLHVGNGRWAATGDSIAALIEADGHEVSREYYVNDAGEQIRVFGDSVLRLARGEPLDDLHYQGDYVHEIADQLEEQLGGEALRASDPDEVGQLAVRRMVDRIAHVLHELGVDYDTWFSERTLHDSGAIDDTIDDLGDAGHTYEKDGAVFLRTEQHGDDKDRVLLRSDGRPTYFAADCAYMRDKWSRGDRLFYLLGADHHGYVGRLKAAAACLDIPTDRIEIVIGQLVTLLRGGEPVRLSKRAGEFVTLEEVVEEVGVDVTRYHFLRQSLDSTIDFDLATVAEQSMENPVYYVQYAHARIASLVRTADERDFEHGMLGDADLTRLEHPAEEELVRKMAALPETVSTAAEFRAPHRLAHYAEDLAGSFHRFYTECRVLVDDHELARARYWLAVAAKQVLANALSLLRVSAPERM